MMVDYGLPEGWSIKAQPFDFGRFIGVAVTNNKQGSECRRYAVRSTPGATEAQAIREALPMLKRWMREHGHVIERPVPTE